MKKIKILETFAGIGAQNKAAKRINNFFGKKYFEVVATCEWDIGANISYNAIHKTKNIKLPSKEVQIKYLSANTWSKDGSTPIKEGSLLRLSNREVELLYKSVKNHNNFGSIITLSGQDIIEEVGKVDMITYSFPCQNLSTAGAFHGTNLGMKKGEGTRSGLLWEIERILIDLKKLNKLPKYLLLENVKAMLFKANLKDFKKWVSFLKTLGYKTNTQILKGTDFGIPQARERVFALSILDYDGPIDKNKEPDIKYTKRKMKKLSSIINHKFSTEEYIECVPNATPSRIRMREDNPFLLESTQTRTITTKQDRHPNAGTIAYPNNIKGKSQYRFISPREAIILMGFDSKDYDSIKKTGMRKELIYKQAGNSIIVNKIEAILEWIVNYENNK